MIDTGFRPKAALAKNNRHIRMDGDSVVAIECPEGVNPCSLCDLSEIEFNPEGEIFINCSAEYYAGWDDEDMNLCKMGKDNDIPYYFLLESEANYINRLNIDEVQLAKECHEFCIFHQDGCYNGPNCLLKILEKYNNKE